MQRTPSARFAGALIAAAFAILASPLALAADSNDASVLRSFDFAAPNADTDGWVFGWNKSDSLVIDDVDVEAGVGLKLSMKAAANAWGDANIKLPNLGSPYPAAVRMRLLVPAAAGRIRSLQIGCALNSPWSESKVWIDFKPTDKVSINGNEFNAQDITCQLGASDPKQSELILRFGGDRVRYQGPLYLQTIKLLKGA